MVLLIFMVMEQETEMANYLKPNLRGASPQSCKIVESEYKNTSVVFGIGGKHFTIRFKTTDGKEGILEFDEKEAAQIKDKL
jgi:hypothetical protein